MRGPFIRMSQIALGALALVAPATAQAQEPAIRLSQGGAPWKISRASSAIKIDGSLDEKAWDDALVIPLNHEWFPGDATKPPVETEALVTFDTKHLFVAFRAHDPDPSKIRAHLMDRDNIDTFTQDDHVTLMIDTFNDERRAFQFRVNALGVQADAIFSEIEGIEDFSWDIIWDSAGRIRNDGYVVEIAIPVNQIRFPSGEGPQTWGFEFGRSYPRSFRHRIAANVRDRDQSCLLCQIGKLSGFQGMEPGLNLELDPTLTAGRTDEIDSFPDGHLEPGDEEYEAGLTARWGITPNLTLNGAVNPDFSQVEADVAQLAVNERFALHFPEKRPFFLEGVDFFATPIDAVFTRTINEMEWGAKFTGKQDRNAMGVFVARDEAPPFLIIPSNQLSVLAPLDTEVDTSVLRYRRDVGSSSTLGVLFTGREGDDYHNRVGGLDGFLRLSAANTLTFQYLRADTQYPDAFAASTGQSPDSFADRAFTADYEYISRNWQASVVYEDLGEAFRADGGFVPRVDVKTATAVGQRRFWGESGDWYSQVNVGGAGNRTKNHGGQLTDEQLQLFANCSGPLQSYVQISAERNKEFFLGTLHEGLDRAQMLFQIQPGGAVKTSLFVNRGDAIDYSSNREADLLQVVPGVELKLGQHLNAKLDHELRKLEIRGKELFEANLTQLRLVYQFNVRTFARAIVQRQDVAYPSGPDFEDVFMQLLFSYKVNPQTVLFLGYTEDRATHFTDPRTSITSFADDLTRIDRTFFFKLGYAWIL